jgi:nucleoside phosphorylase
VAEEGRLGKAKAVVLTIIEEEFEAVQRHFGLAHFKGGYGFQEEPTHRSHDLVVYQSNDRFNLAASGSVTKIVRDFLPDRLIVVGIAGGIASRGTALGDVIVPQFIHYSELAKHIDDKVLWRYVSYDHPSTTLLGESVRDVHRRNTWAQNISVVRPAAGDVRVRLGESIIAGDKIWGNLNDDAQKLTLDRFEDAVAVETESAGVARAVFTARCEYNHNLQYVVIRAISDLVDQIENQTTRDIWRRYAADVAASFAVDLIDRMAQSATDVAFVATDLI